MSAIIITASISTLTSLANLALKGALDANNPALGNIIALGKEEYESLNWFNKNLMDRQIRKALTGKAKFEIHGPYGSNKKFEYNEGSIKGSLQALVFIGELNPKKGTVNHETMSNMAKAISVVLYGLSGQLKTDAKKAKEDIKKEVEQIQNEIRAINPDHKVKAESDVSSLSSLGKIVADRAKASVGIKDDANNKGTNMVSKGSAWASAKVVCNKDARILHDKEEKVFFVTAYIVPGTTWYKAVDRAHLSDDVDFECMEQLIEEFKYE